MEFLQPTFDWLGTSWLGVASREVSWIFVAAETVHLSAYRFFLAHC